MPLPPEQTDATAVLVAGRYRLTEPIARGGVAWVWRAHDETLDREVAVKIVRADADPVLIERFRAEAQIAARVRHPGVVSVYDAGVHDGVPFLAMELLEGESLRRVLERDGALTTERAVAIARQLASALDAMRRSGLVHGDVKPENIIIGEHGAKITDLGLARSVWEQGVSSNGDAYGTPGYVAPEQRAGEATDHRGDVYALGVVLFEALTGQAPPPDGALPRASWINPTIPEDLSAVIARATDPDPSVRYPTTAAMALQLAVRGIDARDERETSLLGAPDRATVALRAAPVSPAPAGRRYGALTRLGTLRAHRRSLVGLAAALVVLTAVAWAPWRRATVPMVVGFEQSAAVAALADAGFDPAIEQIHDPEVAPGLVIDTSPRPGDRVRRGAIVTVRISLGPRIVPIPIVEGATLDDARALLSDAGFIDIAKVEVFSGVVATGLVVGTDPPEGTRSPVNETVTVEVSKGVDRVEIPEVSGRALDEARQIIRDADFEVAIASESSREVTKGFVIRTMPAAAVRAPRGSTVTLVVSTGAPKAKVPDLRCMSEGQAKDAAGEAGFEIAFEGRGDVVVDQTPAPGAREPEGSTITAYTGFGFYCDGARDRGKNG